MSKIRMRRFRVSILAVSLALAGAAHALRPICADPPCTVQSPPIRLPPPPPPQYVSPPDVVVQFSSCLNSAAGAFVDGLRTSIVGAMQSLDLNHDDPPPNPDVRATCVNGTQLFGAWLYQPGSYGGTDTATARNVGLSQQSVIAGNETFGFRFHPQAIRRLVSIRMQDQPRTLDDDGYPDPSGDVHLNGNFAIDCTNSDYYGRTVVDLGLDGWYDGLFSNTDFTIHIFDFITSPSMAASTAKRRRGRRPPRPRSTPSSPRSLEAQAARWATSSTADRAARSLAWCRGRSSCPTRRSRRSSATRASTHTTPAA